MNPEEYKKLAEYQQEVTRLQRGLAKFNRKLAALPAKYGFKTMSDFIAALKQSEQNPVDAAARANGPKAKSGKRVKITPEIKQQVKALVAGGKTGAAIAKEIGISLPSVQNIKTELGLVKKRK